MSDHDPVNRPSHYSADGSIECIDAMRAAFQPSEVAAFCKLNSFKYIWRAGKKGDTVEDLEKAMVYLGWTIDAVQDDEPVLEADGAAVAEQIKQRSFAEYMEGQARAAKRLDIRHPASVGCDDESITDPPRRTSDHADAVASCCPPPLRGASSY